MSPEANLLADFAEAWLKAETRMGAVTFTGSRQRFRRDELEAAIALVRASAPSVAPCPDPFNETHEHQWVTETRCYRCGVVTAIKDGDHISFSTTGKPNPPKWPESAPSVVEPAKEPWQSDDLHGFGNAAGPAKRLHAADCQSLDYDRCSCTCGATAPSAVEAKEPQ